MSTYTLNKLGHEIMEVYRDTVKDTDSLDMRLIRQWIHDTRALFIKQKIQKSIFSLDKSLVQDLGKITLEFVDTSVDDSIVLGENILLSTISVPRAIENNSGLEYFTHISTVDRTERRFKFIDTELLPQAGKSRFDFETVYVFRLGDKLALFSRDETYKVLESINVRGIFQNPEEAALVGNPSYTFDDDYPITMSMVDEIKMTIFKNYLKMTIDQPDDKTLDQEHNLTRE